MGSRRKRQHYVPLHYLRQFSADKKRVNLYNIRRNFYVLAPIRAQCKDKFFYGEDERWEKWLGTVESTCAQALQRLTVADAVPPCGSEDRTCAILWTAVQKVRTMLHADELATMLSRADEVLYPTEAARRWASEREMRVQTTRARATLQSLGLADTVFRAIEDLQVAILQSDKNEFWTSDNPIQEYNIYTEKDNVLSWLGAGSEGLLLFVPLCPRRCMLLYDGVVYEMRNKGRGTGVVRATAKDVDFANKLQAIACTEHIYFRGDEEASRVEIELRRTRRRRADASGIIREAVNPNDDSDTLIHMAKRMHNLTMTLSFINIRKAAQRVPVSRRGRHVRSKRRHTDRPAPYHPVGGGQAFVATKVHYAKRTRL